MLVELDKFHLPLADENPFVTLENRPDFWEESWLRDALHELSTRNMPPDKYEQMMRAMGRRSAVLQQEQMWEEGRLAAIAAQEKAAAAQQRLALAQQQLAAVQQQAAAATQAALEATVRNLLRQSRLTVEEIADSCGITPEQVRRLQPQ